MSMMGERPGSSAMPGGSVDDGGQTGPTLPPSQLEALKAYAITGDRTAAAELVGITTFAYRDRLAKAFATLDVNSAVSAFRVLGWLRIPE